MTNKEKKAWNAALEMAAQFARDRGEHQLAEKFLLHKKKTAKPAKPEFIEIVEYSDIILKSSNS